MKKYYYLLSLFFVFILPTIVIYAFIYNIIKLLPLFLFIFNILIIGSIWDIWATKHGKNDSFWIWQFNHQETLGIKFFGLPVEEYLFYIFSSTYIIFLWEGIKYGYEEQNFIMLFVLLFSSLISIFFILLPYIIKNKNDIILEK